MSKKVTLKKILKELKELNERVANIELMNLRPQFDVIPYIQELCNDLRPHEYPAIWHGTTPPTCNKCGKSSNTPNITYVTTSHTTDDEQQTNITVPSQYLD